MSFFEITGRRPLSGSLAVHGAKNSVLPILAACILAPGRCVVQNCPCLTDVTATLNILRELGCKAWREDAAVVVDATSVERAVIPEKLMREMRSSVIFLGAILARLGQVQLTYPGGCELGPRPIDLHLDALRKLGAEIREEDGVLYCRTPNGLHGGEVRLTFPSVGATENVMLAACGCTETTTIHGAAREPEIEDLQAFLNSMGACVSGAGSDTITVRGVPRLRPAEHRVMGDRIVAATYLSAVAAAGGEVEVTGVCPEHLSTVLRVLEEAGCCIRCRDERICLCGSGELRGAAPIRTAPYPGFPTDAQAVVMAALASGRGSTVFEETMFQSRFRHVGELSRMGADICLNGRKAVVRGTRLHGADVYSTDLRGGASLVVAALAAEGVSRVGELHHVDRGYEGLELALSQLGAEIYRKNG